MLYTFYKFIKHCKDEKMSNSTIRSASVVLFAGIVMIFSWSFERYSRAIPSLSHLTDPFAGLYGLCLAIQTTTLLIFFFVRLNMIFKATPFELSKCKVRFFIGLFASLFLLWFVILIAAFGFNIDVVLLLPLVALLFLTNVTIIISVSGMLIYKLISVYKMEVTKKEKNNGLISSITKTVILNTTCILFTILDVFGIVIFFIISYFTIIIFKFNWVTIHYCLWIANNNIWFFFNIVTEVRRFISF